MSGQATGWVFRFGPKDRAMRMVLLAVADAANRDGAHAHPGLAAIVEGSLYGRAHVYRTLERLIEEGWLTVEEQGNGRGRATVYTVNGVSEGGPLNRPIVRRPDEPNPPIEHEEPSHPAAETVPSEGSSLCPSTVENNVTINGVGETPTASLPSIVATSPHLTEAQALCEEFAALLSARGERTNGKARSKRWVVEMDALLRLDGRTPAQARWVIRWLDGGADRVAQFWRPNVRSPAKLREKWVQMSEQYHALANPAPKPTFLTRPGAEPLADALARIRGTQPELPAVIR